jgi:hypothetical protein
VLCRVKEERNILQRIKRKKANWIGHILYRSCLLGHWWGVGENSSDGRMMMKM